MELVEKKLSELIPYANNPRKNDGAVDAVVESIKQCGYISPIVIDENNEVLAGHTRLKALKRMKAKTVKCVVMEGLTEWETMITALPFLLLCLQTKCTKTPIKSGGVLTITRNAYLLPSVGLFEIKTTEQVTKPIAN